MVASHQQRDRAWASLCQGKVYFEHNTAVYKGGMIGSAPLRDRDLEAFLQNLI